jgi:hypothetical protein
MTTRQRTTIELPEGAASALRSLADALGYTNPKHAGAGGSLSGFLTALAGTYQADAPATVARLSPLLHSARDAGQEGIDDGHRNLRLS